MKADTKIAVTFPDGKTYHAFVGILSTVFVLGCRDKGEWPAEVEPGYLAMDTEAEAALWWREHSMEWVLEQIPQLPFRWELFAFLVSPDDTSDYYTAVEERFESREYPLGYTEADWNAATFTKA